MKTVFNLKKLIASTALLAAAMGVSFSASAVPGRPQVSYATISFGNDTSGGNYSVCGGPCIFDYSGNLTDTGNYYREFSGFDENGDRITTSFSGRAYSQSAYGTLKTYATATVNNPITQQSSNPLFVDENFTVNNNGMPNAFEASATASFSDMLTISSSSSLSYIRLQLSLTGKISGDDDLVDGFNELFASSSILLAGYVSANPRRGFTYIDTTSNLRFNDQTFNQVIWSNPIPVVNNQALFDVQLTSGVSFRELKGGIYSGTSDFSHTLNVSSIVGYDATNQQVNLNSVIGSSGTRYIGPASIPEPASLALLGIGLVGMGWARRRRA